MGRKAQDLTGQRKGLLTIGTRTGYRGPYILWSVRCDCGTEKEMTASQLQGQTVSCGCHRNAVATKRLTTHGKAAGGNAHTRVYRIWNAMKQRCQNPNQPHYERYGGRGITVCDRWQKFAEFYADMGDPPTDQHSIDRIDNDRGYEPGNCRWATLIEQAQNKRVRGRSPP